MSFTSLTVDIDATGSPIDRAIDNINIHVMNKFDLSTQIDKVLEHE